MIESYAVGKRRRWVDGVASEVWCCHGECMGCSVLFVSTVSEVTVIELVDSGARAMDDGVTLVCNCSSDIGESGDAAVVTELPDRN